MNFIEDTIKIDFPVNKAIRIMMEKCEEDDRNNDYGRYINDAESLTENLAKEACVNGEITREQWNLIEMRYPQ